MAWQKIVVLDFGSQYAHLIAKGFRLLGYHSELVLPSADIKEFKGAAGIVLSGGPASVFGGNAPLFNREILDLDIPILGLCYGHQLLAHLYGGTVGRAAVGEFGFAQLEQKEAPFSPLFAGVEFPAQVWMSHQDEVLALPQGFEVVASTKVCACAAIQDLSRRRFGLQCHVEVKDTPAGSLILKNFAQYCGMEKNWGQYAVLEMILAQIRFSAQDKKVLLFLSGGVDSTVAFALLNKSLGADRVLGLHIDNGFMRKNESEKIARRYREFGFTNFIVEDASEGFLAVVGTETDPQKKRELIGEHFIEVRNQVVKKLELHEDEWLLAQGTLYPDIIESGGTLHSHIIKTHHNRVDGVQALIDKGLIIEPLKELYKDEVRVLGRCMGLHDELVMRHPFPGPGLSINVLCSTGRLSAEDEAKLTQIQMDVLNLLEHEGLRATSAAVLPVRAVGVQGDFRTYRFPIALTFEVPPERHSMDNIMQLYGQESPDAQDVLCSIPSWKVLDRLSSFITNSVVSVNRVVVCLYRRPEVKLLLQEGYCCKRRLDQTREADAIVLGELKRFGWYEEIFQHLTINLPYASSPEHCSLVLRPVISEDAMTARFAPINQEVLSSIMARLIALPFVDAIYYDITNKPPATLGWE